MKRSLLIALAFIGCVSMTSFAQQTKGKSPKDGQKEVRMEIVNGQKVLTVTTYKDGSAHEMRYTGEAAKKKQQELEAEKKEGETMEVKVIEVDGKKKLTIVKTKDGVVSEEVYEGEEADAKLKEIEAAERKNDVKIKEKKKVLEKSNM